MPILNDEDIQTREVLEWKGLHLLHFAASSCSQKTRIFLRLKGIPWESRPVNLPERENYSDWFMGINPRGLVPVLIDDGTVVIESNDILNYLEERFPEPHLIPAARNQEAQQLLEQEDALHLDLRAISFRYFFPGAPIRSEELLEKYQKLGSGTVGGVSDSHKQVEVEFHRDMQANDGVSDERIRQAVANFKSAFDDLDQRLANSPYLLGHEISLIDIAWYIYSKRLFGAGYPIHEQHPRVGQWFDGLDARPEFSAEVAEPPKLIEMRTAMHRAQQANNATLISVAGL
ncbi:MAG: glutathione S-transferase family protein [Pseudomonadota bacterium]